MADAGAVLKFPVTKQPAKAASASPAPVPPKLNQYTREESLSIYEIASSVRKKSEDFVTFVEQNRGVARQAGVEMLAVQLTSILEGGKFQQVMDALEASAFGNVPLSLTQEGADKISRMERLVADVDHVIVSFMNGRRVEPMMGQTPSLPASIQVPLYQERSSDGISAWIPVIIIGVAGIVGVIAIISLSGQPSVIPSFVHPRPSRKS